MANTLEQIIADLEKTASAEPEVEGSVETPETVVVTDEVAELQKIAELEDMKGRIQARGFVDEIQKIAVTVTGMTPNTGAIPANPAVQIATSDAHEADVSKVESIIKKLTLGGEQKMSPSGVIHENNIPVAATQPIAIDEHPVAADAKTASEEIISSLYDKWFQD